jgi:hypothetical protein
MRTRTLPPLAALVLVSLVALTGAGCSNKPSESGSNNATTYEGAVKFAECMRHNGVKEFPDPDASGELTIDGIANRSSLHPNTAAFKKAFSACKDLEPAGFTGRKRNASEQKAALEFAQCIRKNGVKDFPDPVNGESLVDTHKIPSSNRPGGKSILRAAMNKCAPLVRVAAGGQG